MAKVQTISSGQKWRKKNDQPSATWTVVSVSVEGVIGLSGPGICRSYQNVDDDVLLQDWVLVSTL